MKLPNGYGSVYKQSGKRKRRRPYIVVKTEGYNSKGNPKRKVIGYAATKEEGLQMLSAYNKDPWDREKAETTFAEVFKLWRDHTSLTAGTVRNYTSRYNKYCQSLYDVPYSKLRTYHFKEVIEKAECSNGMKNNLKKLFRALDKTAMEYDIIKKSYSQFLENYTVEHKSRVPFTEEEINTLWDNLDILDTDVVLIYLYTGFRREELADIRVEDIDLNNMTIKGGSKTEAGKNRLVPIHPRILPLIKNRIESSKNGLLLPFKGTTLADHFKRCMKRFGMKHVIHECRHTLRTRLDNAGANKIVIDRILGHASSSIGERVYTHKTIEQLHEAIRLIK